MNEYNDYLIHFGVKGMKWGVRKDKYKSADKQTRKKYRDEYKKTDEYKKKVSTAKKVAIGTVAGALALAGGATIANMASYSLTGRSIIDNITGSNPKSTIGTNGTYYTHDGHGHTIRIDNNPNSNSMTMQGGSDSLRNWMDDERKMENAYDYLKKKYSSRR